MEEQTLRRIFQELCERLQTKGKELLFPDQSRKAVLDQTLFQKIPPKKTQQSITFIDAGNAELVSSPSFSLQMIRLCATTYEGREAKENKAKEFFVLIVLQEKENTFCYTISTFGADYQFPSYHAFDPLLTQGKHRATPQVITDHVRTLSELFFMQELQGEILIRDGDLDLIHEEEKRMLKALIATKKIGGLAKTNSVITNTGNSAAPVLQHLAPKGTWWYPLGKDERGIFSFFVKLHPLSEYIFRLDLHEGHPEEILSSLEEISKDPLFLGYPYALLAADRYARISNQEKEMMIMKFLTLAGKDALILKPYLRTQDAHALLDKVS
ncbi:hypothetical protein J4410_03845 [Candidatus Woesearchaeota archaeon]|nr:hypothetical protein [Candidatus Woesearchaeota archaeon]